MDFMPSVSKVLDRRQTFSYVINQSRYFVLLTSLQRIIHLKFCYNRRKLTSYIRLCRVSFYICQSWNSTCLSSNLDCLLLNERVVLLSLGMLMDTQKCNNKFTLKALTFILETYKFSNFIEFFNLKIASCHFHTNVGSFYPPSCFLFILM